MSNRLFTLQAYEKIANDRTQDYEDRALVIDDLCKQTEPGMLVHALTKVQKTDDYTEYCWLEVFAHMDAFQAHVDNPHVAEHHQFLNSGVMIAPLKLVIYCDWTEAEKAHWSKSLDGVEVVYAHTITGFYLPR